MNTRMFWTAVAMLSLVVAVIQQVSLAGEEDKAKGLYYEQLDQPGKSINTGIQYWIELRRGDEITRVSNKFNFRSGDKIRFHVRSNIDGYAYIVLRSGSRGEQSVLFPVEGEDNRIARGQDYSLPSDGYLVFDNNPGTEKVTLLLSRGKLDATAYLTRPAQQERLLIASAAEGAKDLIPSKIYLSFGTPASASPATPTSASAPKPTAAPASQSAAAASAPKPTAAPASRSAAAASKQKAKPVVQRKKTTVTASRRSSSSVAGAQERSQTASSITESTQAASDSSTRTPSASEAQEPAQTEQQGTTAAGSDEHGQYGRGNDEPGSDVVTVVHSDPLGVLEMEVDLQHI